jgi:hypothetical protein
MQIPIGLMLILGDLNVPGGAKGVYYLLMEVKAAAIAKEQICSQSITRSQS